MGITLKTIQIQKLNFNNPMLFGETRQLQADIKNKFDYNDDLKKCIVTINCTVKESVPAQNNKGLSIKLSVIGEYGTDDTFDKNDKETKLLMVRQVFPYVRNTVSIISSISGIPVITMPIINIDSIL